MAQGKNSCRNSDGVCRRICNAVSPLRAAMRRISQQPQGSTEIAKPVVHTKMIPIEHQDKEIMIANGQKIGKSGSKKRGPDHHQAEKSTQGEGDHKPNRVSFAKAMAKSKKDDDSPLHEAKFADYISKVKNRLMKAMSNVGHENGTA